VKDPDAPEGVAGSKETSHWVLRHSRAADAGAVRRILTRLALELAAVALVALVLVACSTCVGLVLLPYLWQPYARVFAVLRLRRAVSRGARLRPSEPWTWGTEGGADGVHRPFERTQRGRRRLATGLGLIAFAVLVAMAFARFRAVAVIAGVPGTIFLWIGYRDVRAGSLRIAWPKWPLHIGERAEFTVGVSDGGARFERMTARLRAIEEHTHREHLAWCTWTDLREFSRDEAPGPGHDVLVTFDVPAVARGTRLDTREACWWELEVFGPSDAGVLRERFAVPIYDRPVMPLAIDGAANPPDPAASA
jgi:hypothetical protein